MKIWKSDCRRPKKSDIIFGKVIGGEFNRAAYIAFGDEDENFSRLANTKERTTRGLRNPHVYHGDIFNRDNHERPTDVPADGEPDGRNRANATGSNSFGLPRDAARGRGHDAAHGHGGRSVAQKQNLPRGHGALLL